MIYIVEDTSRKMTGTTSLFLLFDYKPELINIVKSSGQSIWDKKTSTWEVPVTSLSFLLDNLTYYDDITLKLLNKDTQLVECKSTLQFKTKPFQHQLDAINYGLNNNNWLLLDSPGLGKTKTIINLAEELKDKKQIEHCLVICGIATLRANWEKEIKIHSDLSYITIGKKINSRGTVNWVTIKERAEQLKNKIDEFFVIINVESLRDDSVVEAINNSVNKFDMIVVDELHKCKGTSAQQSHSLLKIKNATYKVGLSGTLIMNNALDSYIPLKWIGVEHATLTTFKNMYCIFGGFGGHQIVGFKNLDLLKDEIENCSLRRTKDLMDLPPKNIINEYVEMNDTHRKFYDDVRKGVKEECDKIDLKPNNILALTTRLRQATTCPSVLTTNNVISSKIERCLDLVDELVSQGDKVVIMSSFKEPVYQLKELLKDYNPLIGTGDMKDDEVSQNIDLFQNDNEHKVIIVTISKCGTGITLNRARYLIMLDEPWTEALYQQATDRIHRINNTEPVFIYNLICENTIDETVSKIIERKKAISEFIVDDKLDTDAINILKDYIQDL